MEKSIPLQRKTTSLVRSLEKRLGRDLTTWEHKLMLLAEEIIAEDTLLRKEGGSE